MNRVYTLPSRVFARPVLVLPELYFHSNRDLIWYTNSYCLFQLYNLFFNAASCQIPAELTNT